MNKNPITDKGHISTGKYFIEPPFVYFSDYKPIEMNACLFSLWPINTEEKIVKCECGEDKAKKLGAIGGKHSHWCPKYKGE